MKNAMLHTTGLRWSAKSLVFLACASLYLAANAGPFAYTANQSNNTVSVVDTATDTLVSTIPVGARPRRLAINALATEVYVSNVNGNSVSVIDTNESSALKNTLVATIAVGNSPSGVAYSADGSKVYVVNAADNSVSVIDTAQRQVIATVPVGAQLLSAPGGLVPYGIAVHPNGQQVFVVNAGANSISVIDTATNTSAAPISLTAPSGAALSLDGAKLYVVNQSAPLPPQISIFDTATFAQIGSPIPFPGGGSGIGGAAMGQDGAQFCVVQNASNILCLDTTTLSLTTTNGGSGLFGYLDFTPSGAAYVPVLQSNQLRHLTLPGGAIQANVPLGSGTQPVQVVLGRIPVVTGDPPIGLAGASYTFTPMAYGGITFAATGLPAGLSIDPNTGVISGIPTQAGTFTPTITLTNQAGTASHQPSLVIYNLQAQPDSETTLADTPISSSVVANDTVEPVGASVTYTLATSTSNGNLVFDPSNGSYTYTPAAGFTGTDSFTYQICLTAPNAAVCSATAGVNISVNGVLPGAPSINDASYTTPINTPVAANAGTGGQVPTGSTYQTVTPPMHGQLTLDPTTGAFTYTPVASYVGTDTVTVRVCLPTPNNTVCDDATLTFDVQGGGEEEGGGSSVKAVPTVSEWGLLGLTSLVAMFGLVHVRRRQS